MSVVLRTEPPTDSQISFLQRLAAERGIPFPAPASKQEASLLIDEIIKRTHRPEWDDRSAETPSDQEADWLARELYEQDCGGG